MDGILIRAICNKWIWKYIDWIHILYLQIKICNDGQMKNQKIIWIIWISTVVSEKSNHFYNIIIWCHSETVPNLKNSKIRIKIYRKFEKLNYIWIQCL